MRLCRRSTCAQHGPWLLWKRGPFLVFLKALYGVAGTLDTLGGLTQCGSRKNGGREMAIRKTIQGGDSPN